jgi:aminoglycoside phosphotransferase (APT) family kinase protein
MSRKLPAAVLSEDLERHPATAAWRSFAQDAADPKHIEVLRHGRKSATYRLVGAGPGGASIIAQRSCTAKARIERMVYERILPLLPVTSPRYYGARGEDSEYEWLFLEDIGHKRFTVTDPSQRALAGRWVALMHTAASLVAAARDLPDAGPPRYLDYLRADLQTIRANLANPALSPEDEATLRRLVSDLDRLEGAWAAVEHACTGIPSTLVHGDLQRKNLYIRDDAEESVLYAIDWETAGWGVPAADLTKIDLTTYWSVVRRIWSDVRLEDVRRLAVVGRIFLELVGIRWTSPQLAYDSATFLSRPMSWLRVMHGRLTDAMLELEGIA